MRGKGKEVGGGGSAAPRTWNFCFAWITKDFWIFLIFDLKCESANMNPEAASQSCCCCCCSCFCCCCFFFLWIYCGFCFIIIVFLSKCLFIKHPDLLLFWIYYEVLFANWCGRPVASVATLTGKWNIGKYFSYNIAIDNGLAQVTLFSL